MKKAQHAHEKSGRAPDDYAAGGQVLTLTSKLLLSVPEVAELLGVSSRTVFLLLASGDLARRKVRRRTMIHRDDVWRFATRGSASPQEPRA